MMKAKLIMLSLNSLAMGALMITEIAQIVGHGGLWVHCLNCALFAANLWIITDTLRNLFAYADAFDCLKEQMFALPIEGEDGDV